MAKKFQRFLDAQINSEACIGKKNALKKYEQFALNTSYFWGSIRSNIAPDVQFYEIFVTKIVNKIIYVLLLLKQKFREIRI